MQGKVPTRTCIACGRQSDKQDFLRVVRSPHGRVCVDPSGKAAGRGAYICLDEGCLATARKKRLFDAKLRIKLTPGDYDSIENDFRAVCSMTADKRSRDGE